MARFCALYFSLATSVAYAGVTSLSLTSGALTNNTGTGAMRTICSASLPSIRRFTPRRPWVPITMRSASQAFACSTTVSDTRVAKLSKSNVSTLTPLAADKVVGQDGLLGVLPEADFVALTCPLTPQTENLIDAKALAAMKPSAYLINVARGKVVNERALVEALQARRIAGAALDCVWEEPLPATSGLWGVPNVLITPHTAGETRRYEDNVIDLLLENLGRMWRGETALKNQFV